MSFSFGSYYFADKERKNGKCNSFALKKLNERGGVRRVMKKKPSDVLIDQLINRTRIIYDPFQTSTER